jgi:hypothetical protein
MQRLFRPRLVSRLATAIALAAIMFCLGTGRSTAQTHLDRRDCTKGWPALSGSLDATPLPVNSVVGKSIAFRWRLTGLPQGGAPTFDSPTYLVLLTPEAVRFEGTGFFALTSGAQGPYKMKFGQGRTRAIVPLHTRFSGAAGEIGIIPYGAGEMTLDWALVQADGCGEHVAEVRGSLSTEILPGAPQLVASNQFTDTTPEKQITPKAGPFRATVYQGFIEVRDSSTGQIVLQTTGREPVFSPTGRFLSVATDEAQISDVFDLVTERRIGRFQSAAMYWSHADSFLYLDQEWGGAMQVVRTLHGARESVDSAPTESSLTAYREEDTTAPEVLLDGGLDATSQDIDPGEGGYSFTKGSEAWRFEVPLEGGVIGLVQWSLAAHDYQEPGETVDGLIIDLCRGHAMIKTATKSGLDEILSSGFGISKPAIVGWNAHETIRRTFDYYSSESYRRVQAREASQDADDGDDPTAFSQDDGQAQNGDGPGSQSPIRFSSEPTQTVKAVSSAREAASSEGDFQVRGAVAIAAAPARIEDLQLGLGLDSGTEIPVLRSGTQAGALNRIAAELSGFYDPSAVAFGKWPAHYNTEPFPRPDMKAGSDGPVLFDINIPGRDTWRWVSGDRRYWLTQTVDSGRLGHNFSFTLLGEDSGRLRYADLLAQKDAGADTADDTTGSVAGLHQRGDFRTDLMAAFEQPSFVSVAESRYLLVVTRPVVRLIIFDLASWKPACIVSQPYNQAAIERVALLEKGLYIAQVNKGGGVEIYSCSNGSRILSGIFADGELVVTDGSGRFDGSQDASAYVELKIPGLPGRQLLSQFATRLRVPGLAHSILGGKSLGAPPEPVAPPSLQITFSTSGGRKAARIDARSLGGLHSLQILAGGRVVRRMPLAGKQATVTLSAGDLGQGGIATAIATDESGMASAPLEFALQKSAKREPGQLLGLTVGIDKYPAMRGSDLKYAASDAKRIASAVRSNARYRGVQIGSLVDGAATAQAIEAKLDSIVKRAKPGDTILLAFAGHGLLDRTGRLRLALSSTSAQALEETSLDFNEIASRMSLAQARVIVLLDVCHAGASGQASVASNDEAVNLLTTKSGAGVVIVSASKGRQFSEEAADIRGGQFSVAFERALTKDRRLTDRDGNGRISLNELYGAVKSKVTIQTSGRQIPWLARNQIFGDFDLF